MAAEGAMILTPTEISNIRNYVQHKFAALPQEQRAEIIADAIQRIIMKQLPSFEETVKKTLTSALLRSIVLIQGRPVGPEDIFRVCLSQNMKNEQLANPLLEWINDRLQASISIGELRAILPETNEAMDETSAILAWERLVQLSEKKVSLAVEPPTPAAEEPVRSGIVVPLFKPRARRRLLPVMYGLLSVLLVASIMFYTSVMSAKQQSETNLMSSLPSKWVTNLPVTLKPNELPPDLQYITIDNARLKQFLKGRASVLAEDPYYDAIIKTAQEQNIHPLLLFAITGQEQGFVSKNNKNAELIANNPFNVFHSWKEYNTTIHDSADIAARTVLRWSKDRPEERDPIQWINRKYAEDPNWHKGVRSIFESLKHHVETTS
ncbi:glucosaminidase domain-containing protein [Paenibacillus abyssi]|uniref:Uncharacterized protein n=1 Tax=Paenibacillus abyssi TaxID=1340531 RepID=A0A917FKZ2_9BACL|nr:glucosaminidase domain-containing protein [Paenibacillus abyssi]GGF90062.1 hypothetical protein GCM10010916_04290 [Paenibacillus abyssi]